MAKLIRVFDDNDAPIRVQFYIDPNNSPVLAEWYRSLPHGGVSSALREALEAGLEYLGMTQGGEVTPASKRRRPAKERHVQPREPRDSLGGNPIQPQRPVQPAPAAASATVLPTESAPTHPMPNDMELDDNTAAILLQIGDES